MKLYLPCLLLIALFFSQKTFGQSSPATLDVVSWNIEWFGATFEAPIDDELQRENAKKIIRYLDADMYGLVEMVDTAQIRRLVDSLGSNYAYVISDYCSNAAAPGTAAWRNGQKLMFLYKRDIFSNVSTRGLLRSSATANTNWATGRFPFLLTADATINGITRTINFIVIHAKSGTSSTDYDRRRAGAKELKDTLDAQFPNAINLIIGDYNDALNQTISVGSGPETSFQPIVVDSTDADHYKSITLPLSNLGYTSTINFPNVIDNHIISNEAVPYYLPGSAQIRNDVVAVVPDYMSGNTSDHWPVFSSYNLSGVISSVPDVPAAELGLFAFPNPIAGELYLRTTKTLSQVQVRLLNVAGQELHRQYYPLLQAGSTVQPTLSFSALTRGVYFLQAQTPKFSTVIKLTRL